MKPKQRGRPVLVLQVLVRLEPVHNTRRIRGFVESFDALAKDAEYSPRSKLDSLICRQLRMRRGHRVRASLPRDALRDLDIVDRVEQRNLLLEQPAPADRHAIASQCKTSQS